MTLKILQPQTITSANIVSSNVALETLWTAGTYTLGTQRRYNDMLWEVSAATTTETPSDDATDWFSLGPANRYRAFDQQIGLDQYRVIETVTSNVGSITYTLTGLSQIMGIAMFGLVAESVSIVATDVSTGDVLDLTYQLQDSTQYNGSFWRWAFLPKSFESQYVNFEAYIPRGVTVTISINNTGDTAQVAAIVMGIVTEFGSVKDGASRSVRSRSIIKTEGTLTSLVRRLPSSTVSFDVHLRNYQSTVFWPLIEAIDGVAAVFSGPTANRDLVIYGFHTSATTTAMVDGYSTAKIEVQSL